ncbi:hypothetical protein [Pelagibius marinus]|uniref:hypothetical protein n=1 Tax=Pelagibius marinus TaxID=2762760 RepID=UPI0018727261|nr:hypothetical protein [Pelagibius marinus]
MFKVLILVCSTALAPSECQVDSAVSVINGPEAPDARLCGLNGQAYLAGTALAARHEDEYVKVKCSRTAIGKTVG